MRIKQESVLWQWNVVNITGNLAPLYFFAEFIEILVILFIVDRKKWTVSLSYANESNCVVSNNHFSDYNQVLLSLCYY